MKRYEVDFEGKKRTIEVPDNFDPSNPNSQYEVQEFFWAQDSKNKLGPYAEYLDKVFEGIGAATIDPAGSAFNIAEEERELGVRALKDAVSKFKSGKIGPAAFKTMMGSFQWLFSPVTGFTRAFAGDPVEAGTGAILEAAGIDPEIGVRDIPGVGEDLAEWGGDYQLKEFLGDTATLGAEFIQPGGVSRALKDIPEQVRKFDAKSSARTREINELENPTVREDVAGAADEAVDASGAFVPRASVPLTRDVVTNPTFMQKVDAIRDVAGGDTQRLYKDVGDVMYEAIRSGEVPLSSVSRLTRDLDMDPAEFVKAWTTSIREAGQSLNVLSQAAKQMARDPSLPDGMKLQLEELSRQIARDKSISKPEKFMNVLRSVENFRRGMMVSQLKTSVRNAGSSIGRITMASFDDAAQAILGGGSMKNMWHSISSDMKSLPGIRNKELLNQVLDGNPLTKDQLLYTSANEANSLHTISRAVNTMNVFQERAFRKYAFQAKLEKLARDAGVKLDEMDPNKIPDQWLETATKHALDMTFAASGGKMAKKAVKMYDDFPILYTISNPFPRFVFGNSIPFLIEHSPYGLMKALSPRVVNDLAKGDSKEFAKAASRGLIGSTMLAWAMDLRNQAGGEKWYELAVENEDGSTTNIDTRPYAPMSIYLFMAQVIDDARNPDRPSTLTPGDFTDVALGLNRVGGTGLILSDILRSGDVKSVKDIMAKFGGDWLGAFTTPLAQVRDIVQAIPERFGGTGDSTARDTKGDTIPEKILGPTARNLPYVETLLPPRRSPLKQGVIEQQSVAGMPGGISSQITGANLVNKNPVQQEVDRLALNYSTWNPRTGIKELDRRLTPYISQYVPVIENLINSEQYINATDAEKKVRLEEELRKIKGYARDQLIGTSKNQYTDGRLFKDNPELLRKYLMEQRFSNSQMGLLEQLGVTP